MFRRAVYALACVLALTLPVAAQEQTGQIQGSVRDSSGAVLPGVTVEITNTSTGAVAATVVTEDPAAAESFLGDYAGTGAFWNATTRLLDGFELLGAPETGINVDHVPGPRGPVTYRDLHLRQYVVGPGAP